jgi:hypothetical protein
MATLQVLRRRRRRKKKEEKEGKKKSVFLSYFSFYASILKRKTYSASGKDCFKVIEESVICN